MKAQSGKKIPADLTAHLAKDAGALKKFIEQWKQDETKIEIPGKKQQREKQQREKQSG